MIRYQCFSKFCSKAKSWAECSTALLDNVLAGTGSTAAGIISVLYEIASHPKWQSRPYLELKSLSDDRDLVSDSLSTISTLQALIKESLRIHPPFAGPFERVITPGGEGALPHIGRLPVGTRIWCSQFAICQLSDIYGDDADKFRPERWLDSPLHLLKQMNDAFFVFGRGSRTLHRQGLSMDDDGESSCCSEFLPIYKAVCYEASLGRVLTVR